MANGCKELDGPGRSNSKDAKIRGPKSNQSRTSKNTLSTSRASNHKTEYSSECSTSAIGESSKNLRKKEKFSLPPPVGTRTGLRSQSKNLRTVDKAVDPRWIPKTEGTSSRPETALAHTSSVSPVDISSHKCHQRVSTSCNSVASSNTIPEETDKTSHHKSLKRSKGKNSVSASGPRPKSRRKAAGTDAAGGEKSLSGANNSAITGDSSSKVKRSSTSSPSGGQSSGRRQSGRSQLSQQAALNSAAASNSSNSAPETPGAESVMSAAANNNGENPQTSSNDDTLAGFPPMTAGLLSEVIFGAAAAADNRNMGTSPGSSPFDSTTAASDPELQRLQAMLEARRLPPHLFGALGSSVRHILHRSMNNTTMSKVQSLIKGMQAKEDEGQQLTAVMEMCQVLVMGNEDSLAGFPIKQVIPELVSLLHMEHNFDIMNHACRALTYMLEALPRSSPVVVEAVPALLDKLKCIQCMDVAEQSLSALEMLSKRHNKNLLQAGAIAASLMYLDFFSTTAQRSALAVTANCCTNTSPEEFHYVRESLPLLSNNLLNADKKSVESVCMCFARLVDNLYHDEKLLKELAAHEMLANMLKLLVVSPPVISSSTFTMVIRMFVLMCSNCSELAVCLLRQNITDALVFLLVGQQDAAKPIELVSRSPQELYEIVSLIGEMMPALPTTGLFAVNSIIKKHPLMALGDEEIIWQWKDDKDAWRNYSPMDSRIIEAAYESSEDEVSLAAAGRMYTIDFTMMQQINEETGNTRTVQRCTEASAVKRQRSSSVNDVIKPDARSEVLSEQPSLATNFIKSLFGILYEVYSSSAGPAVRHKCLQALLRQIYYASPELLSEVLVNQPVSSHIASMLASQDHKVVVGAIQMADILMRKLPQVFMQYFQRQGVTHQIKQLAVDQASGNNTSSKTSLHPIHDSPSSESLKKKESQLAASAASSSSLSEVDGGSKQKRPTKRGLRGKTRSTDKDTSEHHGLRRKTAGSRKDGSQSSYGSNSKLSKSSFLAHLHPSRWSRSNNDKASSSEYRGISTASLISNYREKIKTWINQHAQEFMDEHFAKNSTTQQAEGVLHTLCNAVMKLSSHAWDGKSLQNTKEALKTIASSVQYDNISPFEMIHSGVIEKLFDYLTLNSDLATTSSALADDLLPLEDRLSLFLHVFIGSPDQPGIPCLQENIANDSGFYHLVTKAMACLHQQEQFQVKVHDLGMSWNSTSNAMKFFSTHQLKCLLQRHPDCKSLKQWKGGPVKVDPLALVQAIERYLIIRGYCRSKNGPDSADLDTISDEGESEDELDDSMAAMLMAQNSGKHKLEFLIGDKVLPYNMTVYQAIRNHAPMDQSDAENEVDHGLGGSSVWTQTHLIWYRPASDASVSSTSSGSAKKTRSDSGAIAKTRSGKSRKSNDFFLGGSLPQGPSPLISSLSRSAIDKMVIKDTSAATLLLIKSLYIINTYWGSLYTMLTCQPVIQPIDFISSKLTAKANRQLQDPLVIMTGNIPQWLPQVASSCPFLFPFETRQMLFYICSFDRDRAMMRLQDSGTDSTDVDRSRVSPPQLEKKKKTVSRDNLLKQAEKIIDDVGQSKALLEIQYENEVGTGLGPTLEFYSLVSKELQAANLELWHGQTKSVPDADGENKSYIDSSASGLYPLPLARNVKPSHVGKVKAKYRFIGRLMAKALMDSRLLDLPLNHIVYTWLLGQQKLLTPADLVHFDSTLASSYCQLQQLADQVKEIKDDVTTSDEQKELALASLGIEDLCLDFTLPGYSNIQLKKGGKDEPVTSANIHEYLELICHWVFHEGIYRQMESLREGFDQIFTSSQLSDLFYPHELEQLFCGNKTEYWDRKDLYDCCRADHGYTLDSKAVQYLFDILSSYNSEEQRMFLSFVTGSPRLPVGGFRSLNPCLTIVRKTFEANENPDDFLPSVMTCANYLKLPDYSSIDIMREKLQVASSIGQLSFHLS